MAATVRVVCSGCGKEVDEAQQCLDLAMRKAAEIDAINDRLVEAIAIKAERDWLRRVVEMYASRSPAATTEEP